jgi:hypothetical protein
LTLTDRVYLHTITNISEKFVGIFHNLLHIIAVERDSRNILAVPNKIVAGK